MGAGTPAALQQRREAACDSGWALAAGVSLRTGRWLLAALCPLALALLVGFAIPDRIRDAKQPQNFVRHIQERLAQSRFILADNPGVASAIAWQLKRSDILFYSSKGELEYGLSYADARKRYVGGAEFADWLRVRRREGDVALVLLLDAGQKAPDAMLPVPDDIWQQGRLLYYSYRRTP